MKLKIPDQYGISSRKFFPLAKSVGTSEPFFDSFPFWNKKKKTHPETNEQIPFWCQSSTTAMWGESEKKI